MRWFIIRTLIHKEALRHLGNRGGIALPGPLLVLALLVVLAGRPVVPPRAAAGPHRPAAARSALRRRTAADGARRDLGLARVAPAVPRRRGGREGPAAGRDGGPDGRAGIHIRAVAPAGP